MIEDIPDNVIEVDFSCNASDEHSCDECGKNTTAMVHKDTAEGRLDGTMDSALAKVFLVKETQTIGIEFDRPVEVYRMDKENADKLLGALVACFMVMDEKST